MAGPRAYHTYQSATANNPAKEISSTVWNADLTLVNIPGTDIANTFALAQTFTVAPVFTQQSQTRTALGLAIGTNVQAWDADLDAIAALAPSNDDVIQRKAGAWTNRTMAQLATDLGVPSLSGANTWTAQNTFAAGSIATSQPQTITQTWNAAGVTFTGRLINITNTASASASLIEDWQVGGVSVASLRKDSTLAVQDLWVGNVTGTTAAISLRGNPGVSGWYGLGYDNANDATFLFGYAGRKFTLGSRDFGGTYNPRFTFDDGAGVQTWTHAEAINYVFGTTTGTKLGTSVTQKIGFWNVTPVIQPKGAAQAAVAGTAGAAYTGTEQTLINDLKTLVNQLRSDLVAVGIIKGAA